jgi:hypothetical protein
MTTHPTGPRAALDTIEASLIGEVSGAARG